TGAIGSAVRWVVGPAHAGIDPWPSASRPPQRRRPRTRGDRPRPPRTAWCRGPFHVFSCVLSATLSGDSLRGYRAPGLGPGGLSRRGHDSAEGVGVMTPQPDADLPI